MTQKNLLTVDCHYDDETGIYHIGELDFGVSGLLSDYIEKYGSDGRDAILAMLGYLAWKVQETYLEIKRRDSETLSYHKHKG